MEDVSEKNPQEPRSEDRPEEAGVPVAEQLPPSAAAEKSAETSSAEPPSPEPAGGESGPLEPVAAEQAGDTTTTEMPEATSEQTEAASSSLALPASVQEPPAARAAEPQTEETPPAEAVEPVVAAAEESVPAAEEWVEAALRSVDTAEEAAKDLEEAEEDTVEVARERAPAREKAPARSKEAAPPPPAPPAGPRITDLRPGMVMDGTVTRIERYGAFVNLGLADRRDGLIHISELAPYRIRRVEDVVKVGDQVRARVVSVDLGRGRIALSLNDVEAAEYAQEPAAPSQEPALSSIALAFERAYGRRGEGETEENARSAREDRGSKMRREQESLMRRFRSGQ